MPLTGGAQVKIYAPGSSLRDGTAEVACWNIPAYVVTIASFSVGQGQGPNPAVLHKRIADTLGIKTGDKVGFDLRGYSERLYLKVTVKDKVFPDTDLLIHPLADLVPLSVSMDRHGEIMEFSNGDKVESFRQEMWAGIGITCPTGTGILSFDGASRNNPNGPAGCGFSICSSPDGGRTRGSSLVMGSRYLGKRTSNEAEYWGVIEGLYWALRLDLKSLVVEGDSELVIQQLKGEYQVQAPNLKPLRRKVLEMLEGNSRGLSAYKFRYIPREENTISDTLANRAIDLQENTVSCNWTNVNRQMKRRDPIDDL